MDNNYADELYEILDELNARLEEVFNEHENSGVRDLILTKLRNKTLEFVSDFEQEIATMEFMEIEVQKNNIKRMKKEQYTVIMPCILLLVLSLTLMISGFSQYQHSMLNVVLCMNNFITVLTKYYYVPRQKLL